MYEREKGENNVLNCLVLLTLVFLGTVLDLIASCAADIMFIF